MTVKLYEAMFVIDSARAKEDYAKAEGECLGCVTRHGGKIVKSVKFDDRKLCFEIGKAKRAVYILVHFEAEGDAIRKIERQAQLNENILRALVLVDEDGIECMAGKERSDSDTASSVSE